LRRSGPTYFEPLVRTADEMARGQATGGGLGYTVLLILTDGQCNDMDATTRAIIEASYGPLSIVIVGVGGADFAAMDFLDSDDALLSAGGKTAARDCVQFVPFRKFAGGTTAGLAGTRLAAEVLAEIPDQVVGHFMRLGVPPPPPVAAVPVPLPAPAGGVGGAPYGGSPVHAQQQPQMVYGGSTRQANV
jgi:copine 5/8/9